VGGGIVVVPVLFHVLSGLGYDSATAMSVAVGTSLASLVPTAFTSARAHRARGSVDSDLLRSWGPWILGGVAIGLVIATIAGGHALKLVFGVAALVVALHMALSKEGFHLRDRLPSTPARQAIATGIGGVSVMMGIGGGTLSVPILSLFNYPIKRAVGTAAAVGLIIGIPGAVGMAYAGLGAAGRPAYCLGWISLPGLLAITPLQVLLAPYGAKIAHAVPANLLRKLFAGFLALTAVRMLWSVLGA
ncbi:MAG: sulfite exporter TauE/SafE family protein, partial [Alphaproteobacteria bacterium]|nr:sulfite exporter TauE/SafE family protein [Alphaproteobacteria bacterium]